MHNSKQSHQEEKQLSPVWLQVVHPGSTNSQCQGELILQCHCLHYRLLRRPKASSGSPVLSNAVPRGTQSQAAALLLKALQGMTDIALLCRLYPPKLLSSSTAQPKPRLAPPSPEAVAKAGRAVLTPRPCQAC